jgi:hypothetical protein
LVEDNINGKKYGPLSPLNSANPPVYGWLISGCCPFMIVHKALVLTPVNHNPGALHLLFVKIVSPARRLQPLISHCRVAHNNRQCQAAAQKFAKA